MADVPHGESPDLTTSDSSWQNLYKIAAAGAVLAMSANLLDVILGFTFLSIFTILSTFVPSLYFTAFYVFGMIGGLLALSWFLLVARRLFQLSR